MGEPLHDDLIELVELSILNDPLLEDEAEEVEL
jgi:hypothetical protein